MNILTIEVLGTGCKKCHQLATNAEMAIAALQIDAEVLHITDPIDIAKRGVLSTPALCVNGTVVSKGQVLSSEQIQSILQTSP